MIKEFPLSWRWTQESHAKFEDSILEQIEPINAVDSLRVLYDENRNFQAINSCSAIESESARNWLRDLKVNADMPILIFWSTTLAVKTKWKIFVEYWDDFCYPASDDVTIIPESGNWKLDYYHYERFNYSEKKLS